MNKLIKLVMILSLVCLSSLALADDTSSKDLPFTHDVGLGVMIGKPTGVTGKFWLDNQSALDFNLGQNEDKHYVVGVNLLVHPHLNHNVKPYFGIGGQLTITDLGCCRTNSDFGLRIPLGIEIFPPGFSAGIFAEVAPGYILTNNVSFFLQSTIGLRFYFL